IDGNRLKQAAECLRGPCSIANPLRNNGISVRRASDVIVERVTAHSARSGGLVTELGSRRVRVSAFTAYDNQFDGLAGYDTRESVFTGLQLHDNLAAGLSFDGDFNQNLLSDVTISRSGSVGIFMRKSRENVFDSLQVRDSREHGIFLSQVDLDTTTPATGNSFTGVVVAGSAGRGIWVNDASDVNNLLAGAQLVSNAAGCVFEAVAGLLLQSAVLCR
ncbi:MAG: right-handed parallel beta-helix repeat-containing protein, partial [Acidimicrobiales bacterium]